jgi:hypothetical protein
VDENAAGSVPPPTPQGIDLLAQANGGTLVGAPNEEWKKLNDGRAERAVTYQGEGIWSFRDGQPATFDTFEVLIPGTDGYNLKDFELFAADAPTGPWTSIGRFTTHNTKLMPDPYQRFSFAPVTARYLKVSLSKDHGGGYIACYEFRLFGTAPAP